MKPSIPLERVRNFSVIAHVDHGKSTIADGILEYTKTIPPREQRAQLLDQMDLEREKGITIKAHPVTMRHCHQGNEYHLNLIDTPGHVDFSYEVSRALRACEGALLVVDAAQGVQAQTIANANLAIELGLEIIPVINKIDLPAADIDEAKRQIEDVIGIDSSEAILCSAKTREGVGDLLQAIIERIPCPDPPEKEDRVQALVFDSHYDPYRGVTLYLRMFGGSLSAKDNLRMVAKGTPVFPIEVGIFSPSQQKLPSLEMGSVGYAVINLKDPKEVKIGDTLTSHNCPAPALAGFQEIQPVMFAGIYPADSASFEQLRDALFKLQLNDSSLTLEQESSSALGFGFRCGFLGLLHLEIIAERLRREFDLDLLTTTPSVVYRFTLKDGSVQEISNPAHYPDPGKIAFVEEPWVVARFVIPSDYTGKLMDLVTEKRGVLISTDQVDQRRLLFSYHLPLSEIITGMSDQIKSITQGYGSFDYELNTYERSDVVKLDIRLNGEVVESFSLIVHRGKADRRGRAICETLKEVIPQQLFSVPIQAVVGGKVIARETIRARGKNVTEKLYGGDITRKRKLWEKQKKGRKDLQKVAKVDVPHKAFIKVMKATGDIA